MAKLMYLGKGNPLSTNYKDCKDPFRFLVNVPPLRDMLAIAPDPAGERFGVQGEPNSARSNKPWRFIDLNRVGAGMGGGTGL